MFLQHSKSISILDKEQKKHQASPFAFMCVLADTFFLFFGYSLLILKKPVVMCSFYLNRLLETTCFQ